MFLRRDRKGHALPVEIGIKSDRILEARSGGSILSLGLTCLAYVYMTWKPKEIEGRLHFSRMIEPAVFRFADGLDLFLCDETDSGTAPVRFLISIAAISRGGRFAMQLTLTKSVLPKPWLMRLSAT